MHDQYNPQVELNVMLQPGKLRPKRLAASKFKANPSTNGLRMNKKYSIDKYGRGVLSQASKDPRRISH